MKNANHLLFIFMLFCGLYWPKCLSGQEFREVKNQPPAHPELDDYWTGASWIDVDNDNDLDLFLTNRIPGQDPRTNKLYLNQNGKFLEQKTGVLVDDQGYWFGVSWGDYNNDGLVDALVAGYPMALYKNLGQGVFEKVKEGTLKDPTLAGICAAWGDFNLDGNLDFILTRPEWIPGPPRSGEPGGPQVLLSTGPPAYHFNLYIGSDLEVAGRDTYMQPTLSDFDDDGDLDLFIGMGSGVPKPDQMYRNMVEYGMLGFSRIQGTTLSDDPVEGNQWSFEDIDNDGDLDAFVTNWAIMVNNKPQARPNNLYIKDREGYKKVKKGPLVTDPAMSTSAAWGDYDNDGDLDVVVVTDSAFSLKYYQNDGKGNFNSVKAGQLQSIYKHQSSCSAGDFDGDGDLDLFIPGPGDNSSFLENELKNKNHWVNLQLIGTKSNRSAIGAKVWLAAKINGKDVTQRREVSGASTFFGTNSLEVHFGLGDAKRIDTLKVIWPSGRKEIFKGIKLDKKQQLVEGQGTAY